MSIPTSLQKLSGRWSGTNVLYRPWLTPPDTESRSTAVMEAIVGGTFLSITYDWSLDGAPNEGLLLVSREGGSGALHVFWTDSWHLRDKGMLCRGAVKEDGSVDVFGTYEVPGHPDWGWRTVITPRERAFEIVMYNVTPDGQETSAVRSSYQRTT